MNLNALAEQAAHALNAEAALPLMSLAVAPCWCLGLAPPSGSLATPLTETVSLG